MEEGIPDPVKEADRRKEVVLLTESVQLGIPVEHARRDELVKDTDDERREDGEDDVVVGHGPAFERDLAGKAVEPRVLIVSFGCKYVKSASSLPRTDTGQK